MARKKHLVISENGGRGWLHWDMSRGSKWLFPNYTLLFIHTQTQACGPGPLSELLYHPKLTFYVLTPAIS